MSDNKQRYSTSDAQLYDAVGLAGTTYQISYDAAARALGDLTGQTFLDFGSGTGRSAAFLLSLGAARVYGVDHNATMIERATEKQLPGAEFFHIADTEDMGDSVPLPDSSVDGAISFHVFIEFRTLEHMRRICAEVARVVRPGGIFVIIATNPAAYGHTFRNVSLAPPETPHGGALAICTIHNETGSFDILNTYWREEDFRQALEDTGFTVRDINAEIPPYVNTWDTDESKVSHAIVITAVNGETNPH